MALKLTDRIVETTQTTGTGTIDLLGAQAGFRTFGADLTSGDTTPYVIVDDPNTPTAYEYGIGTWTSGSPDTLARTTISGSSNGGNAISLQSGQTYVVTGSPTSLIFNAAQGDHDAPDGVKKLAWLDKLAESNFTQNNKQNSFTELQEFVADSTSQIRFNRNGNTRSWLLQTSGSGGLSFFDSTASQIALDMAAGGVVNFPLMPTIGGDDVVEFATNANGDYVRFADGTQLCTDRGSPVNCDGTGAMGSSNLFRTGQEGWTFPAAFSETAELFVGVSIIRSGNTGICWGSPVVDTITTSNANWFGVSTATGSVRPLLYAIGRWK